MIYSQYDGKKISADFLETRFAKDTGLKCIKMFIEPYFSYQIELFDRVFGTKEKIEMLYDALRRFNSEEEFRTYYNQVKDLAITDIRDNPAFTRFLNDDFNKYAVKSNYCKHDIFNMGNINKTFVSMDLKKANFQALRYYDSSLVTNCSSYEEFISQYTDIPYIIKSKYIRQVIFGNLNTGRQGTIQRFLTNKIVQEIEANANVEIKMFSDDEVVFQISENIKTEGIMKFSETMSKQLGLEIDTEIYTLKQIGNSKKYFVKEFINKTGVEFMKVMGIDMPQVIKFYFGIPIDKDMDLVFMHENRVAHFDEPLDLGGTHGAEV